MNDTYFDPSAQLSEAEPVNSIETEDFTRFSTLAVGNYVSPSRSVTVETRPDGSLSAALNFDGGFIDEGGRLHPAGKYPLKKWISSTLYTVSNRDGQALPGKTSSIAEYLRSVNLFTKGMDLADAELAIHESAVLPVAVFIGRTDRAIKNEATGKYESLKLKTRDFNVAPAGQPPVYAESIEVDGKVYRASAKVTSFKKVAA